MPTLDENQKLQIEIDEAWIMFCESQGPSVEALRQVDPDGLHLNKLAFQNGYLAGARNQMAAVMEGRV